MLKHSIRALLVQIILCIIIGLPIAVFIRDKMEPWARHVFMFMVGVGISIIFQRHWPTSVWINEEEEEEGEDKED